MILNMDKRIFWLRFSYWTGAIIDALFIIPMLSPKIAGKIYDLKDFNPGPDYKYAMIIGASFMLSWTILLLWADRKPVERRDILLLTLLLKVFLDFAPIYLVVNDMIAVQKLMLSFAEASFLYFVMGYAYWISRDMTEPARDVQGESSLG